MILSGCAAEPAPPAARFIPGPPPVLRLFDERGGRLSTLDTGTGTVTRGIALPASDPEEITLTPDARTAVVARHNKILLIDATTGRVRHRPRLDYVTGTALSPDRRTLYVLRQRPARYDSEVVPVDLGSGRSQRPVRFGQMTTTVLVSPDGRTLHVLERALMQVNFDGSETPFTPARLHLVDLATRVVRKVPLPPAAEHIALTRDGRRLFVGAGRALVPVDTTTGSAGAPIAVPGDIRDMAVAPDGRSVHLLHEKATVDGKVPAVAAVDAVAQRVRADIPVPGVEGAWGLSVAPDSRRVDLRGGPANKALNWIDTATDTVGRPIRLGSAPRGIAHRADGSMIYVLTAGTGSRMELVPVDAGSGATRPPFRLPPGLFSIVVA